MILLCLFGVYSTAFCCVRPPGHHAERDRSMGFCYLSNASIGARYAQDSFGLRRVAVLVSNPGKPETLLIF
jgi:acetoin utilization deacetylase AcuC-like enzyme